MVTECIFVSSLFCSHHSVLSVTCVKLFSKGIQCGLQFFEMMNLKEQKSSQDLEMETGFMVDSEDSHPQAEVMKMLNKFKN